MLTVQHIFTNPQPDGTNTQIVRPIDWNSNHGVVGTVFLSEVPVPAIGTPAIIANMNNAFDYEWSAGVVSGGDITDNGNGTVNVTAGETLLRISSSDTAALKSMAFPLANNIALTDNSLNYVFVNYNAGTPVLQVSTDSTAFNCLDKCHLYTIFRNGNQLHILNARQQNVDANRKLRRRYYETDPFEHGKGGTVLGFSSKALTVTAGLFYYALIKVTQAAYDTSVAGTANANVFDYAYSNGAGGWTIVTNQKEIDAVNYDDGTGTLAALTAGHHGLHWVYIVLDYANPRLHVVYGTGDYSTLAEAQAAPVPPNLPADIANMGVLIGRVFIEKNAAACELAESAFDTSFAASGIPNHNDLPAKQGGDSTNFYHFGSSHYNAVTAGSYQLSANMTNYMGTGERNNYFFTSNNTFANNTHTHGNLALTNLNGTSASNGLSLSVAAGGGDGWNPIAAGGSTGNSTQSIIFSNSNNVSFGLNGATMTASAAAGGADGYNILAAAGSTAATTGTIVFSNSNGISFGLNGATMTATVQTNYLTTAANSTHSHGNPTLALTNLSGTTASASNGLTLSLSAAAPGGGVTPAISGSNGSFTFSTLTMGALNGLTFYTSNGSLVGSYTDAGGAGAAPTGNFYMNLNPMIVSAGLSTISSSHNSLYMFPLNPMGGFPYDMTVSTMYLKASVSGSTATLSASHNSSIRIGVYTQSNNGSFVLLNSAQSAWGMVASTNNSTAYQGRRFISIHSSQWSSQPVFKAGSNYYFAILLMSSSRAAQTFNLEGQWIGSSGAHSGTLGVNSTSNTWMGHFPGQGIFTSNTTGYSSGFPAQIANSQLHKTVTVFGFRPLVIFNNVYNTF